MAKGHIMTDCVSMAIRVIEHHDLEYELKRGKHAKIVIQRGDQKRILCTGVTPSDKRGVLNFFATVRRIIKELGVEFKDDSKELIHN